MPKYVRGDPNKQGEIDGEIDGRRLGAQDAASGRKLVAPRDMWPELVGKMGKSSRYRVRWHECFMLAYLAAYTEAPPAEQNVRTEPKPKNNVRTEQKRQAFASLDGVDAVALWHEHRTLHRVAAIAGVSVLYTRQYLTQRLGPNFQTQNA